MTDVLYDRTSERRIAPDYKGDVLVWDIDKTYLDTRFSSWRGLLAIPFEWAVDKRAIPGAVPLLRALRRGPGERSTLVPLYFVSGSPREMRKVIERKMTIDGVEFDGITFKDQLALAKQRNFAAIRKQVGYKLTALLLYRAEIPNAARWLMFGDDVEADARVFLLFGEVCAGLRGEALESRLIEEGVERGDAGRILELSTHIDVTGDPVEKVFIHLASGHDPSSSTPRVIETRSFLQTAMVLCTMGRIRPDAIASIAQDVRDRGGDVPALVADSGLRLGVPPEIQTLVG